MLSAKRWLVAATFAALAPATTAWAEEDPFLPPVDRLTISNAAVRGHPAVRSAHQRAEGARRSASAEGSLPPPEIMVQMWQAPLARPYAVGDAQMIMLGVAQSFPAPGVRSARERAAEHMATAEQTGAAERARQIRREVDHAFAEYVEATARHRIHLDHKGTANRALTVARARHAGGAALSEVTQAEVEVARAESDVVTDRTRADGARARLNVLLGREPGAPLGPPVYGDAEVPALDLAALRAKSRAARPEIAAAGEVHSAREEEALAADREAKLPSFTVGALYFAPTTPSPQHGYGVNASMSLPWLWGEARARQGAKRSVADAAASDRAAMFVAVDGEVAAAEATARASALRLQVLRERALPASHRAFDVAWAGYETGRVDALSLIVAERAVVDVESEIVMARAALDHALAELDASVGAEVPRRVLGPLDPSVMEGERHAP